MNTRDLNILSRTIYGEARGESFEGKVAVGRTIITRWQSGRWYAGKTIADTCQKPFQYSCWNPSDPNRAKLLSVPPDKPSMQNCIRAALAAERGEGPEWLVGCTHYHTLAVMPNWANGHTPAGQIGEHSFYRGIQ